MVSSNVTRHTGNVSSEERSKRTGQKGMVIWLTGLSGSGKSTIAYQVEDRLTSDGLTTYVLDGDNVRHGLNGDLGFADEDRAENLRRVGEVARLFFEAGVITLCSFIAPKRSFRQKIRALFPEGSFVEVHVATALEVCENRDPKGLYKRARAGEIENFTGLSAPYEVPELPELVLDAGEESIETVVEQLYRLIKHRLTDAT